MTLTNGFWIEYALWSRNICKFNDELQKINITHLMFIVFLLWDSMDLLHPKDTMSQLQYFLAIPQQWWDQGLEVAADQIPGTILQALKHYNWERLQDDQQQTQLDIPHSSPDYWRDRNAGDWKFLLYRLCTISFSGTSCQTSLEVTQPCKVFFFLCLLSFCTFALNIIERR